VRLPRRMAAVRERVAGATLDRETAALLVFLVFAVLTGVLLLWMGRHLGFYYDEWDFILDRRGLSAHSLLAPHNEHLVVVPVLVYKVLLATFGFDTYTAWRVVIVVVHITGVLLLFLLVRRQVATSVALLLVVPLLLMGYGYQALFVPFQMTELGSTTAGFGAVLALDSRTRRGDVVATLLLCVAVGCSGIGLSFLVIAAVEMALRDGGGRRAALGRLWVIAVPLVLYAAWWVAYAPHEKDLHDPGVVIAFVVNSAAATLGAITALGFDYGRALLVALVAAAGWRIARLGGIPVRTLSMLAGVVTFWALTGLVRDSFLESRYYLPAAMMVVAAAAALLPRERPSATVVALGTATALLVVVLGTSALKEGRNGLLGFITPALARLQADEVAAAHVDPGYVADPGRAPGAVAGQYLKAVRELGGSPAMPLAQIRRRDPLLREQFDEALIGAERIALAPPSAAAATGPAPVVEGGAATSADAHCVEAAGRHPVLLQLPANGVRFESGDAAPLTVRVRRLGDDAEPEWTQQVASGRSADLRLVTDAMPDPWRATVSGSAGARVCGLPAG